MIAALDWATARSDRGRLPLGAEPGQELAKVMTRCYAMPITSYLACREDFLLASRCVPAVDRSSKIFVDSDLHAGAPVLRSPLDGAWGEYQTGRTGVGGVGQYRGREL